MLLTTDVLEMFEQLEIWYKQYAVFAEPENAFFVIISPGCQLMPV